MRLLIKILTLFVMTYFMGCGYKASSQYARVILTDKLSTNVIVSGEDPGNTVLIKDAVDSAIIELLHISLVRKGLADTHLEFSIADLNYAPLEYDVNGYVIAYKATISLNIKKTTKAFVKHYRASASYDFDIVPNSVLTDQERFLAIQNSASKAISSFLSQVGAEGSTKTQDGKVL